MKEVNDHVKHVMGIKPKNKVKKNYTKEIVWFLLSIVATAIWTTIYNLIF
jgi:hypothetical protein